jgi:F-type H+-transporting ATPase subunit delta
MRAELLYAQVLVDVASDTKQDIDRITEELKTFEGMLKASGALDQILSDPTTAVEDKKKVLSALFKKETFSPLSQRFLEVLVTRRRSNILGEIFSELASLRVAREGGIVGTMTTASPTDAATREAIEAALTKKLNLKVKLNASVDAKLIAGTKVTVGGVTYDGSFENKLNRLQSKFY